MVCIAKDNLSKYVILGILSIKPMSGYDINDWIKKGVGHFWSLSYNQIYPMFKVFESEGLVTYTLEREGNRPEKKIYTVTLKGEETLKNWLCEPIDFTNIQSDRIMLLKLYFGSKVEKKYVFGHLTDFRKHKIKMLEEYSSIEKKMELHHNFEDVTYKFRMAALYEGMSIVKAQIDWCEETISNLMD